MPALELLADERIEAWAKKDKLDSCHVVDSLAVSNKENPHPARLGEEEIVFSGRSCLRKLERGK
jgi:hypothetical protein